jgi:hypothetical protein
MLIQWIIKNSSIEKKKKGTNQPGLDFTRAVGDVMLTLGLASRGTDCCTYSLNGQYNIFTPLTGTTITLTDGIQDNLINPAGTLAALTINLPASPDNGQVILLTFTKAITTLTIAGNGSTLVGTAPTSAAIGTRLAYKFYTGVGFIRLN